MEEEFDIEGYAKEVLTGEEEPKDYEALSDEQLVALVNTEVNLIETDAWDVLAQQRIISTLQFEHALHDDIRATDGMSNVVMNFTSPAVETLETYMTRTFCSDKDTVSFNAVDPAKRQVAEQAMMMVNEVIHKHNPGYKILSQCFKDAAINKNSILKVTWDESTYSYEESYNNINPMQLDAIIMQKEQMGYQAEIVEQVSEESLEVVEVPDPATGELVQVEQATSSMSVTLRCTHSKSMPKIVNVPPEEFLINEGAFAINDDHRTRFVAHRQLIYKSDVMEMFPNADVDSLSAHSTAYDFDWEQQARHIFDGTYDSFQNENGEEATRQYEIVESWIRADRDGDELAEWRHVFTCGSTLLMDEEWFGPIPFASFCYFPIPHKFYGLSVYDKLKDYEKSATALLRSEVDSSVIKNTTRFIADPRFINQRDLLTVKNGVVRALPGFKPEHVMPIVPQSGASNSQHLLELIRQQVIAEIGIDPISGQISKDVEVSGNDAAKTAMVVDNASAKIESYAREFADHTLRDIVWQILTLLVENKDNPSVQYLAESVTPGVPFALGEIGLNNIFNKSDLTAKVGLGHQTAAQKLAGAQVLMAMIQQMAADPVSPVVIPPVQRLNLLYEAAKGNGYENPQAILGSPDQIMAEVQKLEAMKQQQIAMQQAELQLQQQQIQLQAAQIQNQMQIATDQHEFEKGLAVAQHEAEVRKTESEATKKDAEALKTEAETTKTVLETTIASQSGLNEVNVNL